VRTSPSSIQNPGPFGNRAISGGKQRLPNNAAGDGEVSQHLRELRIGAACEDYGIVNLIFVTLTDERSHRAFHRLEVLSVLSGCDDLGEL